MGFGVGLGAVVINYLVWVSVYFVAPVTSEHWGVLWIGVIFPYLVVPLAIVVVWKQCNRKEAAIFSLDS